MRDPDRITVDLQDRIDEIAEEMDRIEREARAIRDGNSKCSSNSGDGGKDDEGGDGGEDDGPTLIELAKSYQELEHAIELIEADIKEFGGSEFAIKKFRAGETGQVNDLVLQDTISDGLDDPRAKFNARKIRTVQVGVTDTPPDTPDSPRVFNTPTLEFLYQRIDNFNSYGEASLSDFSLFQRLDGAGEQPNS